MPQRSFPLLPRLVCLGTLAAVMPLLLQAQENPNSTGAQPAPGMFATPYAIEIVDGTLSYKGKKTEANISSLVEVLRELYPKVNIAVAPQVARTGIADLKLHSSQIEDTLEAMRVASGYRFIWRKGNVPAGSIDPTTGLPVKSAESSLYVLDLGIEPAPLLKRVVEVFNLNGYLQLQGKREPKEINESLKQIQEMVQSTLQMLEQDESVSGIGPSFQFHPGANLLIAIGSPEAIEVARKVVSALPGFSPGTPAVNPRPAPSSDIPEAFYKRYGLTPPARPRTPDEPAPGAQR